MVQKRKDQLFYFTLLTVIAVLIIVIVYLSIERYKLGSVDQGIIFEIPLLCFFSLIVILYYLGYVKTARLIFSIFSQGVVAYRMLAEKDVLQFIIPCLGYVVLSLAIFMFEEEMLKPLMIWSCIFLAGSLVGYIILYGNEVKVYTAEVSISTIITVLIECIAILSVIYYYMCTATSVFQDIKNYSDKIDQNTKEKETFFACMSHEIRNPIQALTSSLELLLPSVVESPETQELIDILKSCCDVVLNLVSNILDISKIQAGMMEMSLSPSDPRETVNKVIRLMKRKAEAKSLDLKCLDCPALPPVLSIDAHKLSQVILNLVSNAVKFTQIGSITVTLFWEPINEPQEEDESELIPNEDGLSSVRLLPYNNSFVASREGKIQRTEQKDPAPGLSVREAPQKEGKGILKISIQDTGIGITPENLSNLFRPFSQANASISRNYGGTGLGLWISQNIIQLMGGQITAESRVGEGTKFSLQFPAEIGQEDSLLADSKEMNDSLPLLRGKRCLIVDDMTDNTFILQHFLKKKGITSRCFNQAEKALECFQSGGKFDAVTTDLRMPGMSGQTMIQEIRKIEKEKSWNPVPIIVISAENSPEERVLCLSEYGANSFLTKPIKLTDLLLQLYKVIVGKEAKNKLILIIEDDSLSSYFLTRTLKNEGHEIIPCYTVERAKEVLREERRRIDMILLDNQLPDGTGIEVLDFLADHEEIKDLIPKTISISGNDPEMQRQVYHSHNLRAFFQKPLRKTQLLGMLK